MITIVTDSTAYLTEKEASALGVRMVPMYYAVDGEFYPESFSGQNGDFTAYLWDKDGKRSTSQGPVAAYSALFRELTEQGGQVLCMVISSRLSGTFSSACIAARYVDEENIRVVDSLTTAGGLYFLIEKAKEMIDKHLPLEEVYQAILTQREQVGVAFTVEKMDSLRKSGRIGFVRQSVGTVLNLRPVLFCIEGAVVFGKVARGRHDLIQKLLSSIPANAQKLRLHFLEETVEIFEFAQKLKKAFPTIQITNHQLGPVLGIHLGKGVIGISWCLPAGE